MQDYITVKEKGSVYLPHTAGRYAAKRFRKAHVSIFDEKSVHHHCTYIISIVPCGRASYQLAHDAWTEQRKEANGRDDCQACVRDHPSVNRRCEGSIFIITSHSLYLSHFVRRIHFKSWLMLFLTVAHARTPRVLAEQARWEDKRSMCRLWGGSTKPSGSSVLVSIATPYLSYPSTQCS